MYVQNLHMCMFIPTGLPNQLACNIDLQIITTLLPCIYSHRPLPSTTVSTQSKSSSEGGAPSNQEDKEIVGEREAGEDGDVANGVNGAPKEPVQQQEVRDVCTQY